MSELKQEFRDILVAAVPVLEFSSGSVDAIVDGIGNAYVLVRKADLPEVTVSPSGYLEAAGRTLAHTSHAPDEMRTLIRATAAVLIHIQEAAAKKEAEAEEARKHRRQELIRELLPAVANGTTYTDVGALSNAHIINHLIDHIIDLKETVP